MTAIWAPLNDFDNFSIYYSGRNSVGDDSATQSDGPGALSLQDTGANNVLIQFNVDGSLYKLAGAFAIAANFVPGDEITLILYDQANNVSSVYNTGAVDFAETKAAGDLDTGEAGSVTYSDNMPHITPLFSLWFDPVKYKSGAIIINRADSTYLDITRVFIGQAFNPAIGQAVGSTLTPVDTGQASRVGGYGNYLPLSVYRRATFEYKHLTPAERDLVLRLSEYNGISQTGLFSMNPNATGWEKINNTILCKRLPESTNKTVMSLSRRRNPSWDKSEVIAADFQTQGNLLTPYDDWIAGTSGAQAGYALYDGSANDEIEVDSGPFGVDGDIWKGYPVGGSPGTLGSSGWRDAPASGIDASKSYLFGVYVRRYTTDGALHFGCSGVNVVMLDNTGADSYFMHKNSPADGWYLYCGVVQAANTDAGVAPLGIGGIYSVDTGRKIDSAEFEFKWSSPAVMTAAHTSFLWQYNAEDNQEHKVSFDRPFIIQLDTIPDIMLFTEIGKNLDQIETSIAVALREV